LLPLVLLASCAHDHDDRASTTTIRSGSPGGVRVTNVTIGDFDPAERLAAELCKREATCGRIEARGTDEAKLLGEQNCIGAATPRVGVELRGWSCSPSLHRDRFEDCQAAIRSERCSTRGLALATLPACREEAICGER
jgi:hypothetical protein